MEDSPRHSAPLGPLLKEARRRRGLSRSALAAAVGVSTRLVGEFERGERPNVSLETALRLFDAVGIELLAAAPDGARAEIRSAATESLHRAARVEQRRRTWTGRQVHLRDADDPPAAPADIAERVAAVAEISRRVYGLAAGSPLIDGREL
jgi:transcriptional regulator with XRE-family HTH domain